MESVRRKVQAMELLLGDQLQAAELEPVAAQYAYELAASRPQVNPDVIESTNQQAGRAQLMRWKHEKAKTIIPRMLGFHSIEEAREVQMALTAVFNAYAGLRQELVSKRELLPALELVAEGAPENDSRWEEIFDLKDNLNDLEMKMKYFERRAKELAEKVDLGEEEGRIALV